MMYVLVLHYLLTVCTPNDCNTPHIESSYSVAWTKKTCQKIGDEAERTSNYKRALGYDCVTRPMVVKP